MVDFWRLSKWSRSHCSGLHNVWLRWPNRGWGDDHRSWQFDSMNLILCTNLNHLISIWWHMAVSLIGRWIRHSYSEDQLDPLQSALTKNQLKKWLVLLFPISWIHSPLLLHFWYLPSFLFHCEKAICKKNLNVLCVIECFVCYWVLFQDMRMYVGHNGHAIVPLSCIDNVAYESVHSACWQGMLTECSTSGEPI